MLVVGHALASAPATPCATPPWIWPSTIIGLIRFPQAVHHRVAQDGDVGGLRVDLDDGGVHAVGEGRPLGGVVVAAVQPRRLPARHRRARRRGLEQAELRRRAGLLAEGVAQRRPWTAPPPCAAGSRRRALPLTRTIPSTISRSSGLASSASAAMRSALARSSRAASAIALPLITAARDANVPHRVAEPPGVAGDDVDVLHRHAQLGRDDLGERGLVALALAGQAGRHVDAPVGLDLDVAALVRPDARALDVAGQADPDAAALRGGLGLAAGEVVPADEVGDHPQRRGEVAAVVDRGPPVLEGQAQVVGHLLGLDDVAAADLGPVQAQLGGDAVDGPLHAERRLRAAGAAVGRDRDGVGVQARELDAVGGPSAGRRARAAGSR